MQVTDPNNTTTVAISPFVKVIVHSSHKELIANLEEARDALNKKAWKCYRCDLTFREESHAFIHTDISNHSTRQIELIRGQS